MLFYNSHWASLCDVTMFAKDCALLWLCVHNGSSKRKRDGVFVKSGEQGLKSFLQFYRCESGQPCSEISHRPLLERSGCFQEDRRPCGFNKSTNMTH